MKKTIFLLLTILIISNSQAQTNISGIINTYGAAIAIDTSINEITLDDATAFSVDDTVLIVQMKGATINETNSASFGNLLSLNNTGNYEYNVVLAKIGNTLTFAYNMQYLYSASSKTQVVKVPSYNGDVNVTANLTAMAWNGSKGGILAFFSNGILTLNANIDVSGLGFRGGQNNNLIDNCVAFVTPDFTDYHHVNGTEFAAGKGEGIASFITNKNAARGKQFNGGGGGNGVQAGGGGGAGYGIGGIGGNNNEPNLFTCDGLFPGIGGDSLNRASRYIFPGAGGAGHGNNTTNNGGNAGGLIFIKANSIVPNGNSILANGNDGLNIGRDGAGGGGGGGLIYLDIPSSSSNFTISATGGNGGNVNALNSDDCQGPGGGAGGGLIVTIASLTSTNNTNGGNPGIITNSTSPCNGNNGSANIGGDGSSKLDTTPFVDFAVPPTPPPPSGTSPEDTIYTCQYSAGIISPSNITNTLSFQWQILIANVWTDLSNGIDYSQVTDTSLIINHSPISFNGNYYRLMLLSATDTLFLDSSVLIVQPANYQTLSDTICNGDSLFISNAWQKTTGTYYDTLAGFAGTPDALSTFYSEDFNSGGLSWTLNTSTGTNAAGGFNNYWVINSDESGQAVGTCSNVPPIGDAVLFVTKNGANTKAVYSEIGALTETNKAAESANISTIGKSSLVLNFDFIGQGDALLDNASLLYSINGGTSWIILDPSLKSTSCGVLANEWEAKSYNLPSTCNNIPNLKIRFNWTNDDSADGDKLSFAVNNIVITEIIPGLPVVCDSIIETTLTVLPNSTGTFDTTICNGASFLFNGTTYDASNLSGIEVLTAANGCDSTITVTVTELNAITGTFDTTICNGASFVFNGTTYNNANLSGTEIFTSAFGCDSTITVTVTELNAITGTFDTTICNGASFIYNGTTYNNANLTGTEILTASNGCDSTVTVTVTELNAITGTFDTTICNGASFIFNGTTYDANNLTGIETLTSAFGCDSTITVTVTELNAITGTFDTTICNGASFIFNGTTYDASNLTGIETLTSAFGCDSTVTVTVTELNAITGTFDTTICNGASFMYNGTTYNNANLTGTEILTASNGCDSTVTITVTELNSITGTFDTTICNGASFMYNGTTYNNANLTGTEILTASNGCDSTVTITVTELNAITGIFDTTICNGASFVYNGTTYDASNLTGTEVFTATNGCDSTVTVSVIELNAITATFDTTICNGASFVYNGTTYDASNLTGTEVFTATNGCDSTVTVTVTELNAITETFDTTICNGASFVYNGTTYDASNLTGTEVFTATNGCDSTVTVTVTELNAITGTFDTTICNGASFVYNGTTYNNANLSGTEVFTSAFGCDSTITVTVTELNAITGTFDTTICDGSSFVFNGTTYDASNITGTEVLTSSFGCDSTVTITLTINPLNYDTSNIVLCFGDSLVLANGTVVNSAGTYTDTVPGGGGSSGGTTQSLFTEDFEGVSFFTLNTNDEGGITPGANDNTWLINNIYTGGNITIAGFNVVIPNTPNQPAGVTNNPQSNYLHITSNFAINNSGPSNCNYLDGTVAFVGGVNGMNFSRMTNDLSTIGFTNVSFSMYYLCAGSWGRVYYSTNSGASWTQVGGNLNSTNWTTLNISNPAFDNQANLRFGFGFLNTDGVAQDPAFAVDQIEVTGLAGAPPSAMCDSIITINVTVNPLIDTTVNDTICANENYMLPSGSLVNTSGTYLDTLVASNSCDSIITTILVIHAIDSITINDTICDNDNYMLPDGSLVNTSGTYLDTLANSNGCDSIITTVLVVNPTYNLILSDTICENDSYSLPSGLVVDTTGIYLDSLLSSSGCDSIYTITLTVNPLNYDTSNVVLCFGDSLVLANGTVVNSAGTYTDTVPGGGGSSGGTTQSLFTEDFEGVSSFTLNTNDEGGITPGANDNTWLINNIYTGGNVTIFGINVVIPNTPNQPAGVTNNPQSNYLHITSNFAINNSGPSNCNYLDGTVAFVGGVNGMNFSRMTNDISTIGFTNVSFSMYYLCAGSWGRVYYSTNSGVSWTQVGGNLNSTNWTTLNISNPAFDNQANLRFGFGFLNTDGVAQDPAFAVDQIEVTGLAGAPPSAMCDSIITINVTVNPLIDTTYNDTICANIPYQLPSGNFVNTAGIHIDTISAVNSCDSVITINLTLIPTSDTTYNDTICSGNNYILPSGTIVTTAGIHLDTIPAINSCDSLITIDLTVLPNISISSQPMDITVCEDSSALIYITSSGTNITYQWQMNIGAGFNDIPGFMNDTLILSNVSTPVDLNGVEFRVLINSDCGASAISDTATISVSYNVVLNSNPNDSTICENENVSFSATTNGNETNVQWQVNSGAGFVNIANNTNYSGATTLNLNISNTPLSFDNNSYQVIVSDNCGFSDTTTIATLTVNPLPTITLHPLASNECLGNNVQFSVIGNNISTYQWQVNTGTGFSNIVGETNNMLNLIGITANMNGNQYQCIVSNSCGNLTSAVAILTVGELGNLLTEPSDVVICPDSPGFNFDLTVTSNNVHIYQWQINTGSGFIDIPTSYLNISGVNSNSLQLTVPYDNIDGVTFRVNYVDDCGIGGVSNEYSVVVSEPDPINGIEDVEMCLREIEVIEVDYDGTDYIWNDDDQTSGRFFEPTESGEYIVTFRQNSSLCLAKDTISVNIVDCLAECIVTAPTAFSPSSSSGMNDLFRAIYGCDLDFYEMIILNRWGEIVFTTNDVTKGWDGTYKGQALPLETYAWYISFSKTGLDKTENISGNVTIVR